MYIIIIDMLFSLKNLSNLKKNKEEISKMYFLGYLNNKPNYLQYMNHNKIDKLNLPKNIDKAIQCDYNNLTNLDKAIQCDYNNLTNLVIQKKETVNVGVQCNIYEDFEIIDDCGIPLSSFLAVGNYLYNNSK